MNKRDKQILNDLQRFRVMSRNDITDLYFSHLKNPITGANTVLKRLARDKQIKVDTSFRPYVYFPYDSIIKKQSAKIPHFLKLVEVYKQIHTYCVPDTFLIEPKYQKGLAEPDIYTKIKGVPFFIEVQRNQYSQKVMNEKIKRYEALYYSDSPNLGSITFPFVIMISDTMYEIESDIVTVFQVTSIHEFMENITKVTPKKEQPKQINNTEIKFKIG